MRPLIHPNAEIVLASRSDRRRDLLSLVVPQGTIRLVPPRNPHEAGFDGLHTPDDFASRLLAIAADKCRDAAEQLDATASACCLIAADTVIVVGSEATGWQALGKPPESDWQNTTGRWFREHYAGRTHLAMTALYATAGGKVQTRVVTTQVTFRTDIDDLLDAYIATGEPQGKAGGYAIQGLGSLFVERVEGSLTNVIGLPVEELVEMLRELEVVGQ